MVEQADFCESSPVNEHEWVADVDLVSALRTFGDITKVPTAYYCDHCGVWKSEEK